MNLREFISAVKPRSNLEALLLIAYFLEVISEKGAFTQPEVGSGFKEARITPPKNLSRDFGTLQAKSALIRLDKNAWALTQVGLEQIVNRLNESGMLSSQPDEPSRVIREVSEKLHNDVLTIGDEAVKSFVSEALACLHPSVNAYRAAVIMGWAAAVHAIRGKLGVLGISTIDAEVRKHYPKKKVVSIDDLMDLKDSELLLVAQSAGVYDKNVRKQLSHCLDLRNACAHPTAVRPQLHSVKAFFEEIIQYALT